MYLTKDSSRTEKMQQYLFNNQPFPFKENDYAFFLIRLEDEQSENTVFSFLEELIPEAILIKINSDYGLFYFTDIDDDFKDLFLSVGDDFAISLKVYASGRISASGLDNFHILCNAARKHILNKPYRFATNAALIAEVLRTDVRKLKELKGAILNRINDDSQMEKLILSMFNNNLNVTQTAKDVYMHRNTIINKLEYIRRETGLNLQNFQDATCLYWLFKMK
jgi:hypothetical protein